MQQRQEPRERDAAPCSARQALRPGGSGWEPRGRGRRRADPRFRSGPPFQAGLANAAAAAAARAPAVAPHSGGPELGAGPHADALAGAAALAAAAARRQADAPAAVWDLVPYTPAGLPGPAERSRGAPVNAQLLSAAADVVAAAASVARLAPGLPATARLVREAAAVARAAAPPPAARQGRAAAVGDQPRRCGRARPGFAVPEHLPPGALQHARAGCLARRVSLCSAPQVLPAGSWVARWLAPLLPAELSAVRARAWARSGVHAKRSPRADRLRPARAGASASGCAASWAVGAPRAAPGAAAR